MDAILKEEPPDVDVMTQEVLVDPLLLIKTELICKAEDGSPAAGSFDDEPQLSAADWAAKSIKAEPFVISLEGTEGKHKHWPSPSSDEAEDHKPVREYSEVADNKGNSCTQPPHGEWGICIEGDLPHTSLLGMDEPDPGCRDPEGRDQASLGSDSGLTPSLKTTVEVENAGAVQAQCGDEFYRTEAGCSTEILSLSQDGGEVFECQMQSKRMTRLKKKLNAHIKEGKHLCKVCNKRFTNINNLNSHIRIHTGEKPFQCTVCDKHFNTAGNLKTHSRTHTGEKPFQCKVCNNQFKTTSHLNRHIRTTHGEKPFLCQLCDKQFSTSSDLANHSRTHAIEKPFQCKVCNKQFVMSIHLTYHSRKHTGEKPYQCNVCNKQFRWSSNLTSHVRTHTGEKPFHCKVCDKQFALANDLNNHTRIHTGEKPFQCKVCNKRFTSSSHLSYHRKTHWREIIPLQSV